MIQFRKTTHPYIIVTFQRDIYYFIMLLCKSIAYRSVKIILPNKDDISSFGINRDNLFCLIIEKLFKQRIESFYVWCDIEIITTFVDLQAGFLMHEIRGNTQKFFSDKISIDFDPIILAISKKYKSEKIINIFKIKLWWVIFNVFSTMEYLKIKKIRAHYIYNSLNLNNETFLDIIEKYDVLFKDSIVKRKGHFLVIFNVLLLYLYYIIKTLIKICTLQVIWKREKFDYVVEALLGLDFSADNNALFWKKDKENRQDILFYSYSKPGALRKETKEEALKRGYRHVDINNTKFNLKYWMSTLYYVHVVPAFIILSFIFKKDENDLLYAYLSQIMNEFYRYYFFCSNYEFKIETNCILHYGYTKVIAYNLWGSKLVSFSLSDLNQATIANTLYWPICNAFVSIGACQKPPFAKTDEVLELGYYFFNISEKNEIRKNVRESLRITDNEKVLSVFDETFGFYHMYNYKCYIKFYQAILKISEELPDIKILIKQKINYTHYIDVIDIKDEEKQILRSLHLSLKGKKNVIYIPLPDVFGKKEHEIVDDDSSMINFKKGSGIIAERIIIGSDVALTMQMHSPSTNANIFGIPGLYYCPGGLNPNPAAKKFYNRLVFEDEKILINVIKDIFAGGNANAYIVNDKESCEYFGLREQNGHDKLVEAILKLKDKIGSDITRGYVA